MLDFQDYIKQLQDKIEIDIKINNDKLMINDIIMIYEVFRYRSYNEYVSIISKLNEDIAIQNNLNMKMHKNSYILIEYHNIIPVEMFNFIKSLCKKYRGGVNNVLV